MLRKYLGPITRIVPPAISVEVARSRLARVLRSRLVHGSACEAGRLFGVASNAGRRPTYYVAQRAFSSWEASIGCVPSKRGQGPVDPVTLRVFVVEDNAVIRANLADALEELAPVKVIGFAEDERTAVKWLHLHSDDCDLLVVDIFLRRGNGLGVLRACQSLTSVHSVVLSNYVTAETTRKCLDLGARRVFDKSSEIEELVEYCVRLDRDRTGL
jgi:CheY-like chemotaxis protein